MGASINGSNSCLPYTDCPADAFDVKLPPSAFSDLKLLALQGLRISEQDGPGELLDVPTSRLQTSNLDKPAQSSGVEGALELHPCWRLGLQSHAWSELLPSQSPAQPFVMWRRCRQHQRSLAIQLAAGTCGSICWKAQMSWVYVSLLLACATGDAQPGNPGPVGHRARGHHTSVLVCAWCLAGVVSIYVRNNSGITGEPRLPCTAAGHDYTKLLGVPHVSRIMLHASCWPCR